MLKAIVITALISLMAIVVGDVLITNDYTLLGIFAMLGGGLGLSNTAVLIALSGLTRKVIIE